MLDKCGGYYSIDETFDLAFCWEMTIACLELVWWEEIMEDSRRIGNNVRTPNSAVSPDATISQPFYHFCKSNF